MTRIRLMHAKLHRVRVTGTRRDYMGSITIDRSLLAKAGILPLEEVNIVNLDNGHRWSTYVIPGDPGSGQVCPNGGGALLCEPGDTLIIWCDEERAREEVLRAGHTARVVIADEHNRCREFLHQSLVPHQDGVEFHSCRMDSARSLSNRQRSSRENVQREPREPTPPMSIRIEQLEPAFRIESVARTDTGVEIRWCDQHASFYPNLWLRDSCRCPECFQHDTSSLGSGHDPLELPLDPSIREVRLTPAGALAIVWGGAEAGHRSAFDPSWLRVHCQTDPARHRGHRRRLWDGSVTMRRFAYQAIMSDDDVWLAWSRQILESGVALIDNAPPDRDSFRALVERVGPLQQRYHPSKIFTLDTADKRAKTIHHAYHYAERLRNHTDHAFYRNTARLQFLGCIRYDHADSPGQGYSTLVDGFKVAEVLRDEHPDRFELLSQEHVPTGRRRFAVEERLSVEEQHTNKYEWDVYQRRHMITTDDTGEVCQVLHNRNARVPLDVSQDKIESLMDAYRTFTELIDAPEYNAEFLLEPGQILVSDNWRVLHGRTAITSPSLHRILLGAYISGETFRSRRRILLGRKSEMPDLWLMGCSDHALEMLSRRMGG